MLILVCLVFGIFYLSWTLLLSLFTNKLSIQTNNRRRVVTDKWKWCLKFQDERYLETSWTRSTNQSPCLFAVHNTVDGGPNAILTTFLNDAEEGSLEEGGERKRSQLDSEAAVVYLLNQMRLNYRYMHQLHTKTKKDNNNLAFCIVSLQWKYVR